VITSMALFPPSHRAGLSWWEMAESSPQGSARRRPAGFRGVPHGGKQP
jgi:hypothetical protein